MVLRWIQNINLAWYPHINVMQVDYEAEDIPITQARRAILIFFTFLSIIITNYSPLTPLVMVEYLDFATEQADLRTKPIHSDEDMRMAYLPIDQYINKVANGQMYRVERGQYWYRFIYESKYLHEGAVYPGFDRKHLSPSDRVRSGLSNYHLFYSMSEAPLSSIADRFKTDKQVMYITRNEKDTGYGIKLTYYLYANKDYKIGSGFSRNPRPSTMYLYPFANYGLILGFIGFMAYILPVLPSRNERTTRRSCVVDLLVHYLLIIPLFIFPILLVGGVTQALTNNLLFTLFSWVLSLLGVWSMLKRPSFLIHFETINE